MNSLLVAVLIGCAAGILLGTAGAKLWAVSCMRLAWPQGANFLRFHLSSGLVIAVEILTGVTAVVVPSARLACLILALVYAAFVIGAITLHGQECGCFGVSGMKVGPFHIWGCALTAVVLAAASLDGQDSIVPVLLRCATALGAALVMVLAVTLWNRRGSETRSVEDDYLLVVLSSTCTACSALKIMEKHEVNDVEVDGRIRWVDRDSEAAASLRDAGVDISSYPSVVSVSGVVPAEVHIGTGLQKCREVLQSWRQRHLVTQA